MVAIAVLVASAGGSSSAEGQSSAGGECSCSGSLKSYQLYLTVCNRQLGKLVRFGNSAQGPARALKRVPDRDSEPRLRRGTLGIWVGIR